MTEGVGETMTGAGGGAGASAGTVLIAEDEPKLAQLVADYLHQSGFTTVQVAVGTEVVDRVRAVAPDVLLLDLMLPGRDGVDICRELRGFTTLPIIVVTARTDEIDRLLGLELGADDYVCKPFSPRELVARVKAVLRRSRITEAPNPDLYRVDPERQQLVVRGRDVGLTSVEFQVVRLLAQRPGWIYSRLQIMQTIYDDGRIVGDRTIDSHVKKIRRKIEAVAPQSDLIQSVYGSGYRFVPPD